MAEKENVYEGMFLLDSGKFAADPDGVTNQLLGILEKAGATVVAHRPWQEGKLAYAIDGHRKGLHYLVLFRMPGEGNEVIKRGCKLSEVVLRHMVLKQHPKIFDAVVTTLGQETAEAESETAEEGGASSGEEPSAAEAEKVAGGAS